MILVCSLLIPYRSLVCVFGYTDAGTVAVAECGLPVRAVLHGRLLIPCESLGIVNLCAPAILVAVADVVLTESIAGIGRLYIIRQGNTVVLLYACNTLVIAVADVVEGFCIAFVSKKLIVMACFGLVFYDAVLAVPVDVGEVADGSVITLLCRLLIPFNGFVHVLLHTLCRLIHKAEAEHGRRIVLFGRFEIPDESLAIVNSGVITKLVEDAEVVLCCGMPHLGSLAVETEGACRVFLAIDILVHDVAGKTVHGL